MVSIIKKETEKPVEYPTKETTENLTEEPIENPIEETLEKPTKNHRLKYNSDKEFIKDFKDGQNPFSWVLECFNKNNSEVKIDFLYDDKLLKKQIDKLSYFESNNIISAIKEGTIVTKEPSYSQTTFSKGINDIGNTYVEIDLAKQHIWFYKNGSHGCINSPYNVARTIYNNIELNPPVVCY